MFRKLMIFAIFLVIVINLFNGCTKHSPIVAAIGNKDVIRLDEFKKEFLKSKPLKQAEKSTLDERKNLLNKLIDDRLLLIGAKEANMDQDSVVKAHVEGFKKGEMIKKLYDIVIIDKIIKEKDIRDLYARLAKEATVRMIFIKKPADNSIEKIKTAKDKAQKALDRIKNGEAFAKVAKEVSDDPSSRERGGLIQTMTWVKKDDPIRKTIFSMKEGQISGIVDNKQGLFIFKVEKFKTIKQEPYKNARKQMRKRLSSMNRAALSSEAKKFLKNAKAEYIVSWQDSSLKKFAGKISPFAQASRTDLVDSLKKLPADIKNMTLVKCKNSNFTVNDFITRVRITPERRQLALYRKEGVQLAIDGWLTEDALIHQAKQKGVDKNHQIVFNADIQLKNEMVKRFVNNDIETNVVAGEKEMHDFYEANKEKKYSLPEQVKVQEIMVRDKALAYKIAKRAKKGESFSRLAKKYTERTRYKKKNGVIGYIPKGAWGVIGDKAFHMKPGQISDPISLGKRFSIIKLLDRKAKEIQPFNKVEDRVKRDVIKDIKNRRKQEWLANKRNELKVKIYDAVLAQAFE